MTSITNSYDQAKEITMKKYNMNEVEYEANKKTIEDTFDFQSTVFNIALRELRDGVIKEFKKRWER